MTRYTLKKMREELGISSTRIVNIARDGRQYDGHYIRMEKSKHGAGRTSEFWLESVDGSEVEVSGGLECDQESDDTTEPEVTVDWLTQVDGVGEKGAGKLVDHLKKEGIDRTFAAVAELEDLTVLPSIGKKNGEHLRAAVDAKLPTQPDPCEQCGEDRQLKVYGLAANRFNDPQAAKEKLDDVIDQVDDLTAEMIETDYPDLEPRKIEGKSIDYWIEFFRFDINDVQPHEKKVREQSEAEEKPDTLPGVVIDRADRYHPMLPECRFLGNAAHDTDEWHALRARGIGSSDAGAIMGFSDHATNQDVWATKIGEEPDEKPWLKPYAHFGTWFEPFLRHHLEVTFDIKIVPGAELGTLQWTGWSRALANIDGLDVVTGAIEELKTSSEEWREVPLAYEAQAQHQMMVTGAHECRLRNFICPIPRDLFPSLLERFRRLESLPGTGDRELADWLLEHGEIQTIILERDEDYMRRMIARERAFWEHVDLEIIPPMADPDGTVDLTDDPEAYAALCAYGRIDREWSEVAKPIKKKRRARKDKARRAIDRAVGLDYGPDERPKRIKVGDHKATLSTSRAGTEYWRLYPGEEDVDLGGDR